MGIHVHLHHATWHQSVHWDRLDLEFLAVSTITLCCVLVQCQGGYSCPWVTGNTQWSKAIPWLGMEAGLSSSIQQSCTGLNTGINSGFSQSPTLCSCPQCCGRWAGMCTPPPSPPSPGRPAYCGSCMQFGNVYTITAA